MSQETLPSKHAQTKSCLLQKNFTHTSTTNPLNLTKVLNPLVSTTATKHYLKGPEINTIHSVSNSRLPSYKPSENQNNLNLKTFHQPKLKNPHYNFYRPDLNSSSDVSFMNSTFQDQRDQIEQRITQKFNNSKCQIQDLIQQSPSKKRKRLDTKQAKREKLGFYHCDEIIIRPCVSNKSVKVIDLAICPTKPTSGLSSKNIQVQAGSMKKLSEKKLLDLIQESPMENSKNYNNHQFIMDSPSFLNEQQEGRVQSKSAKDIQIRDFGNEAAGHEFFNKEENFETKSNTSHHSEASIKQRQKNSLVCIENSMRSVGNSVKSIRNSGKSGKNSLQKRAIAGNEQNMQENVNAIGFQRRNRIFDNSKKYGLKLSRAIREQKEIQMLKGELGVDVFHIIIEEDELYRQCCT